jgi:precorrin-4 methylase
MLRKRLRLNLFMSALFVLIFAGQGGANPSGKFFLVGIGPGDADLITVRAIETIQKSDVIICSKEQAERFKRYTAGKRIVSPPMLSYWQALEKKCYAPAHQDKVACSKINAKRKERAAMIRDLVAAGNTVAMLESGDPCIFGCLRWIKLEFSDDEFEVIPGISSFNVSNALLKREVADAYVADFQTRSIILTSPLRNGERQDRLEELASHRSTMVFFMPREFEKRALSQLRRHYPADTPVAVVSGAGDQDKETILRGTLAEFPIQTEEQRWQSLIYVGGFLGDALNLNQ